jgi:hypothetical protein
VKSRGAAGRARGAINSILDRGANQRLNAARWSRACWPLNGRSRRPRPTLSALSRQMGDLCRAIDVLEASRPAGMLPLPVPQQCGSIESLNSFLNLARRDDFAAIKGREHKRKRIREDGSALGLGTLPTAPRNDGPTSHPPVYSCVGWNASAMPYSSFSSVWASFPLRLFRTIIRVVCRVPLRQIWPCVFVSFRELELKYAF